MTPILKRVAAAAALAALVAAALLAWQPWRSTGPGPGFVSGNGRLEATEVAVATRLPGRLLSVAVAEGEFVQAGQVLARLDVASLQAQRDEAAARLRQGLEAGRSAVLQVQLRRDEHRAACALQDQRASELDAARRRLRRSEALARDGFLARQPLDDDAARVRSLEAAQRAARAQALAAASAIEAFRAQATAAEAQVRALEAGLRRMEAELAEAELRAPRDARVQGLVAEAGEVVAAGGRVMTLVDVTEVFFTFFLPETVAGRVALGSEVRLVLDAAPGRVVPARVSFVSAIAQFTPRTVETASERQKLMFRVRARVDRALLQRHRDQVKSGLPGVAWLRLDAGVPWPASLSPSVAP